MKMNIRFGLMMAAIFTLTNCAKENDAPVKEVIVTNSMPKKENSIDKIKQVDLSMQIAEAMKTISA